MNSSVSPLPHIQALIEGGGLQLQVPQEIVPYHTCRCAQPFLPRGVQARAYQPFERGRAFIHTLGAFRDACGECLENLMHAKFR